MAMNLVPEMNGYEDKINGIKIEDLKAGYGWRAFDKKINDRANSAMVIYPYNSGAGVKVTFNSETVVTEFNVYIDNTNTYGKMSFIVITNDKGENQRFDQVMDPKNGPQKFIFKLTKPLIGTSFSLTTSVGSDSIYVQEIELFGMRSGYVLLEINGKLCTIVNGNVTVINSTISNLDDFTNHAVPIGTVIKNMNAIKNVGEGFKILSVSM